MENSEIVSQLAPCGLNCRRCADYDCGKIKELSTELLYELRDNYGRVAKMKADNTPVFAQYPAFEEILRALSQASCGGCRSENNRCPLNCHAKNCHKEKGVSFCFQCEEYPCDRQDGMLRKRWMENNNRMKEIGIQAYYDEQAKLPRY